MIVRQNENINTYAERKRLLIESGVETSEHNTRADIRLEYTKLNQTSMFNLRSLIRKLNTIIEEFHSNTESKILNARMEGVLFNRATGEKKENEIIHISKQTEYGIFFKPERLMFTVVYSHPYRVDIRETVQTAQFTTKLSSFISPSTYDIDSYINNEKIDYNDLTVVFLGGGLAYDRIRPVYLALNKGISKATLTTFEELYNRRHNCGKTLGLHSRRILNALGYNTLDADRFFSAKDPDADNNPAEVEFYSLRRHTLRVSEINKMYNVFKKYIYPDADTKYVLDIQGKLLLDAEPDTMKEWLSNPNFKILNIEFLKDYIVETDKCSADDFFEALYSERPGWRPKYD